MKTFKVFTKKIAISLRERGFDIVAVEVNKKKPQFDVYIFKDTESFREVFTELSKIK